MQDNNKDKSGDKDGASSSWQTPGIVLRKARREQGIAEEDVCRKLGLRIGVLKALESDDYERLPSAVYVKGYIRGYSSLLGLDEQPILASYESYCQQMPGSNGCEDSGNSTAAVMPVWKKQALCIGAGAMIAIVALLVIFL